MPGLTWELLSVGTGVLALAVAGSLTVPVRRFAVRHDITDRPGPRKSHARPTPYLGGVAVAMATVAAALTAWGVLSQWSLVPLVLMGSAVVICALGLADDLRPLGVRTRLCVEAAAAAAVVFTGGHPVFFGNGLDALVAIGWIVFTVNAFNLLDNLDGAAAAVAAVIGMFLSWTMMAGGQAATALALTALAGACAGFLLHNWYPARIFLGDAGSLFLGFVLASGAVVSHSGSAASSEYTGLLMTTLVTTADTGLVLLSRRRAGRPLLLGGTDHISHRLRRLGLTVPQTACILAALAAASCLAGTLVESHALACEAVVLLVLALTSASIMCLLRIPVYPAPAEQREPAGKPVAG